VRAAAIGRWDVVPALADLGFAFESAAGFSALHYAAGANHVSTLRFLVERGADLTIEDPEFKSTPLGWAQYLSRAEAVEYLSSLP
jgi:ankyrin repeat protein